MKDEKTQLAAKITDMLKGTELELYKNSKPTSRSYFKAIRETELFFVLRDRFLVTIDAGYVRLFRFEEFVCAIDWEFGKSLAQQSEETITKLLNALNKTDQWRKQAPA